VALAYLNMNSAVNEAYSNMDSGNTNQPNVENNTQQAERPVEILYDIRTWLLFVVISSAIACALTVICILVVQDSVLYFLFLIFSMLANICIGAFWYRRIQKRFSEFIVHILLQIKICDPTEETQICLNQIKMTKKQFLYKMKMLLIILVGSTVGFAGWATMVFFRDSTRFCEASKIKFIIALRNSFLMLMSIPILIFASTTYNKALKVIGERLNCAKTSEQPRPSSHRLVRRSMGNESKRNGLSRQGIVSISKPRKTPMNEKSKSGATSTHNLAPGYSPRTPNIDLIRPKALFSAKLPRPNFKLPRPRSLTSFRVAPVDETGTTPNIRISTVSIQTSKGKSVPDYSEPPNPVNSVKIE